MERTTGKGVFGLAVIRRWILAAALAALVLVAAEPAFAVNAGETAYTGGTIASVAADTVGTLDTGGVKTLVFRSKASGGLGEIDIPYAEITNFQYSSEVTYHIGVAPAVVVSLVKKRKRRHFFTIAYTDSANATQVAVFEVAKDEPKVLLPILRARAPQGCGKVAGNFCGGTLQR